MLATISPDDRVPGLSVKLPDLMGAGRSARLEIRDQISNDKPAD